MTRFFFVSVEADYDKRENASHFGTVGNLLDDVWFSTQVKPAADDEAKLIVSKTVTGLASIDGYSVTMTVNDGRTSQDIVLDNFVSDGNGNYTASKSITYSVPANGGSKTLTVTESAPNVTGYTLDSTAYAVSEEGSNPQTGSGTAVSNVVVNAAHTKTVAFTNTYAADEPPEAPDHHKQAVLIEDPKDPNYGDGYNYKLSLDVIGDTSSTITSTDLNVLMIVDTSASMNESFGDGNKIEAVREAAKNLVTTLEEKTGVGTVYYDIVQFGYYSGTETVLGWTSNTNTVIGTINKLARRNQGTNWQAGIREAIDDLTEIPEEAQNAKTCVIFLTDGGPSCALTTNHSGEIKEDGSGYYVSESYATKAATEAQGMHVDYFYGIGADNAFNWDGKGNKPTEVQYMEKVVNAVNAPNKNWFPATDSTSLGSVFDTIAGSITTGYYDVTISDELSDNVKFVLKDGNPQFEITVTDANSNDVTETEQAAGMSVTVNRNGDQFSWSLGKNYMLKDDYTYTLSVIITPSDTAKAKYAADGIYPDMPDPGTGTHADAHEKGFYSNAKDQATLSYKHSSWNDSLSDKYPRHVVQVPKVGDLVINKEVTGTTVSNATYYFEIETNLNMTDASPKINGTAVSFTKEGDSWKATVDLQATTNDDGVDGTITITGLPIGSYTVTEKTDDASLPTVANYHWVDVAYNGDSSKDQAEVTVGSDTEKPATVAVTNNYEHDDVTLTVTKTVGGNMGDTTKDFTFTLTVTPAQGKTLDYEAIAKTITVTPADKGETAENYSFTNGSVSFEMHSGQQMTVTLPYGCSYSVSENAEGYSFQVTVTGDNNAIQDGVNVSGTMDNNITVAYTNTMVVEVPTGLNRNGTPYTLMVTAAGIAGLALIGGIVAARRRRRRME